MSLSVLIAISIVAGLATGQVVFQIVTFLLAILLAYAAVFGMRLRADLNEIDGGNPEHVLPQILRQHLPEVAVRCRGRTEIRIAPKSSLYEIRLKWSETVAPFSLRMEADSPGRGFLSRRTLAERDAVWHQLLNALKVAGYAPRN